MGSDIYYTALQLKSLPSLSSLFVASKGRQLRGIQEYNCIVLVQKNMIFDVVIVRGRAGLSKNQPAAMGQLKKT